MTYHWHDAEISKPPLGQEVLAAYYINDSTPDGSSSFCLDRGVCYFEKGAVVQIDRSARTTSAFLKGTDKIDQLIEETGWYMLDLNNEEGYLIYRKVKTPAFWTQLLMPDNKTVRGPVFIDKLIFDV